MKNKLETIFFDLDGTLAESKSPISNEMADMLSLLSHHYTLVLISGGMLEQLTKQVIDKLSQNTRFTNWYLMPTSGASLFRYNNGSWVEEYQERLSEHQINTITTSINQALEQVSFTIKEHECKGSQIENRGSQVTFSALGQQQDYEMKKLWDPEKQKRRELQMILEPLLSDFDVKIGGSTSIDITLKGVNKAFGINQFFKVTGTSIKHGLFIGDELVPGGNDYAATETDIQTRMTSGPDETLEILRAILQQNNHNVIK